MADGKQIAAKRKDAKADDTKTGSKLSRAKQSIGKQQKQREATEPKAIWRSKQQDRKPSATKHWKAKR